MSVSNGLNKLGQILLRPLQLIEPFTECCLKDYGLLVTEFLDLTYLKEKYVKSLIAIDNRLIKIHMSIHSGA